MTFVISKRVSSTRNAWLSLAILLGIPILPFWASWAYTDFAWGLFEIVALFCFIIWTQEEESIWIILAGIMGGFALGSKYFAIGSIFLLTIGITWITIKTQKKGKGWIPLLAYASTVLLVAIPWYLKNIAFTGNPVFPFYFGGPGFDDLRQTLHMEYLQSFGTGHDLLDYISIPFNIYLKSEHFSNVSIEIPSLLFPFAFFYPVWHKQKFLRCLALYALFWGIIWSFGSLQTRFLLPIFPILAVLTAYSLDSINFNSLKRIVIILLVGGTILVSLLFQGVEFVKIKPFRTILGLESKNQFIERNLYIHPATQFINNSIASNQRTLFLWSGQSYYCNNNCIPDTTQIDWLWLTKSNPDPIKLSTKLGSNNISYILFSPGHLEWFLQYHDPNENHLKAKNYLFDKFIPQCGEYVFADEFINIIKITCLPLFSNQ